MSDAEWIELLGRDVDNLQHMNLMRGVADLFVRYSAEHQPDLLTEEEGLFLISTAQVHDWGEAITGDISFGFKDAKLDAIEKDAFSVVAAGLYPDDPATLERLAEMRETALNHEGTKLREIFFAMECLGYFRTALRASELALDESLPEETRARLVWLMTDVISNVGIKTLVAAEEYKAVAAAISANKEIIDQAFAINEVHDDTVYLNYGEKAGAKRQAVKDARAAWNFYSKNF